MTEPFDENNVDSAIASWSGFIYQGKIALYHVLKLLCDDTNSLNYELQLDSLEDFAIRYEEKTLTLHQVKSVNSIYYSKFKKDFEKLEAKRAAYPCDDAFFHLAVQNQKSATEIQTLHPTLELYQYSDNNYYCGLPNVDELIKGYISTFLNAHGLEQNNNAYNNQILSNRLDALIFNQVIAIHAENHKPDGLSISESAYHFTIPFQSFVDVLNSDPSTLLDDQYYLFQTKQLLNIWYLEYCSELEKDAEFNNSEVPNQIKNKLINYLDQINELNQEELFEFVKNLIPQRKFKLKSLSDFNNSNITSDDFQLCFLQGLHDLVECQNEVKNGLVWLCKNNSTHLLTAINNPQSQLDKVAKGIYNNITESDYEVPYNTEVLITADINADRLNDVWNNRFEIREGDSIDKNHIAKWGNIALKALPEIKNDINERTN